MSSVKLIFAGYLRGLVRTEAKVLTPGTSTQFSVPSVGLDGNYQILELGPGRLTLAIR
jgi:hypothetical protein